MNTILIGSLIAASLMTFLLSCAVIGSEYLCKSSKVISIIAIFILSFLFVYTGMSAQEREFNNGYCLKCNTKMEAIEHHSGKTYYECPNCYFGTWH